VCGPWKLERYHDPKLNTWRMYSNRGGSDDLALLRRVVLVQVLQAVLRDGEDPAAKRPRALVAEVAEAPVRLEKRLLEHVVGGQPRAQQGSHAQLDPHLEPSLQPPEQPREGLGILPGFPRDALGVRLVVVTHG